MLDLFRNLFAPPRHILLLLAGLWLGLTLAEKRASRHGISRDDLNNILFYGLIAYVLGGRISFVIENFSAFSKSPLGIFSINPDLFEPSGAIAAAILTALIYGQRRSLKFWNTLDALTPVFAVFAVSLGFSHLAAGTAFGKETTLPIGIELWNATRHPVQMYDIGAALLALGWIWLFKANQPAGLLFLSFAALMSFFQILIIPFRAQNAFVFGGIHQAQVIAWMVLASSFALMENQLRPKSSPENKNQI